jgi:hypothetical protein
MSDRPLQSQFARMIGQLIPWASEHGYELTFGDGYRDPRVFGQLGESKGYGRPSSFHKRRLAHDFNLFKNGIYLETTEDHRPLGEFWESIGGSWGGQWGDGNHYSLGESRT